MMSQYKINYSAASSLVTKARVMLGLSKWDKWTEQLKYLCEQVAESENGFIQANDMPTYQSIHNVKYAKTRETCSLVVDTLTDYNPSKSQTWDGKRGAVDELGLDVHKTKGAPSKVESAVNLESNNTDDLPTVSTEVLEQIMMQRHGLSFTKANRLVRAGRASLRMPEWQPWNAALMSMCERLLADASARSVAASTRKKKLVAVNQSETIVKIVTTSAAAMNERCLVDTQYLAHASDAARSLETIIMQRYSLSWCEASDVVKRVRDALGVGKLETSAPKLKEMCDRLLSSQSTKKLRVAISAT